MPDAGFVEGASSVGQLFKDTGGWGLAGVLTLALGWVAKGWRDEARGRLDDQKDMSKALQASTLATAEQTAAIKVREEAFRESVKSQELAVVADREMAAKLTEVKGEVGALKAELTRTREALISKGMITP